MSFLHYPLLNSFCPFFMCVQYIIHSLDMTTSAKQRFLEKFETVILAPRDLDYKVQFTGPTGTNAVEAALRIARIVKKRSHIVAFTNGYHGLTSGSLSVTSHTFYRNSAFTNCQNVSFMPFDGYFGKEISTIDYIRKLIEDDGSGIDLPAAFIIETIQSEGGVNVASKQWLRELTKLCKAFDILLIIDDIQVGIGRTGDFFSFERAGIQPDIITLSKAISGFGLPMSLVLLKPEIDQWKPGEHTGTFRGNNLAFITSAEATDYWQDNLFSKTIKLKSQVLAQTLQRIREQYPELEMEVRGLGLIYGLEIPSPEICKTIARQAFDRGLIIELCGSKNNVLKFLPPLTIEDEVLAEGLKIVEQSINRNL